MVTPTPLHVKVADALRSQIVDGALAVGSAVPSEASLVDEFGASRGTVRQALAALRQEGLIEGGQGRQPVVRARPMKQRFETLYSFSAWAAESGRVPGQRTFEIARRGARPEPALALGLQPGDPVIEVLRLRSLDGEPVMLERFSFTLDVGMLLFEFDTEAGSIYAGLIARGVDLHGAEHTIDAVAAGGKESELLDVPIGSPLLRERRRTTDAQGRAFEYSDDRYRPDRATFTVVNTRSTRMAVVRDLHSPGDTA